MPGFKNFFVDNLCLWAEFLEGDAYAFEKLMHSTYQDLFNYGTRFTKDKELIKDCIQELFLVLWKNRMTINKTVYVKLYLLKSLRRKISRTMKGQNHSHASVELPFKAGFDESIENKIILTESHLQLSQKIRVLLGRLSKREQEVIYLRFYEGARYNEIAEIMCINRQSAYNLLHEALRKLKTSIGTDAL